MTDTSKTISDDFSSADDAPSSPPIVPADVRKLPSGCQATVYAPTSDKEPIAHPDPLQRRKSEAAPLQSSANDDGEWLFTARPSQRLQ
jgi:hypothetical protein